MKRITFIVSLLVFIVFLSACQKEELISGLKEPEVNVITTIYPIQFVVEQIGGETVDVESVYPPGVDAHTFEPTSKDMTAIATSDLFIYVGPAMEGFVESAAKTLANESVTLMSLQEHEELFATSENGEDGVHSEAHHEDVHDDHAHHEDEHDDHGHDHHHHGGVDPHFWIDPVRMITLTEIIADKLIELNPKDEQMYKQNKNELVTHLQKLDRTFSDTLAEKENKYFVVPHAAYGYWEERYGIEQIAVSGLSPSQEPSQKYLTEIIELAKKYEIDYIFYEQNTPDKLIEIIKEEINADVKTIHNLSVLTEDDVTNNDDYFTLMEKNLEVLDEAFK